MLKPGSYRINRYLFDVRVDKDTAATIIPAGHVGVVKSNVSQPGLNCKEEMVRVSQGQHDTDALSVPLVPRGCIGLWREPLLPGAYYLNRHAYDVTLIDTRVQTWKYRADTPRRIIDLSINQQGNLKQRESVEVSMPDHGRGPGGEGQGGRLGHPAGVARRRPGLAGECPHRCRFSRRHPGDRAPHPDTA